MEDDGRLVLVLEDPENPDWMGRAIRRGDGGVSEDELKELARDPYLRQITDDEGRMWRIETMEKPEAVRETADFDRSAPKVVAMSEGGPERVVSLPEGGRLGTLTRDALLEAIRA